MFIPFIRQAANSEKNSTELCPILVDSDTFLYCFILQIDRGNCMVEDRTLTDFLMEAKKKAEDANPGIKKLAEQDPTLYQPIYGYIITFSSN